MYEKTTLLIFKERSTSKQAKVLLSNIKDKIERKFKEIVPKSFVAEGGRKIRNICKTLYMHRNHDPPKI